MSRPRRADATENRKRIVDAARAALADSDDVHLNAIARRAGVGQATLYRNFPTREDLLAEVYRQDVDELVTAAHTLVAEYEPLAALERWFDQLVGYARVKRGVLAAVEAATWRALTDDSHAPISDAVTLLLDAGKATGSVRDDVDARDVILLIGYLARLQDAEWETRARHLLALILDGLRTR
jgi:AcrR family transcriptional regulator